MQDPAQLLDEFEAKVLSPEFRDSIKGLDGSAKIALMGKMRKMHRAFQGVQKQYFSKLKENKEQDEIEVRNLYKNFIHGLYTTLQERHLKTTVELDIKFPEDFLSKYNCMQIIFHSNNMSNTLDHLALPIPDIRKLVSESDAWKQWEEIKKAFEKEYKILKKKIDKFYSTYMEFPNINPN